jgi:hypothetical protein
LVRRAHTGGSSLCRRDEVMHFKGVGGSGAYGGYRLGGPSVVYVTWVFGISCRTSSPGPYTPVVPIEHAEEPEVAVLGGLCQHVAQGTHVGYHRHAVLLCLWCVEHGLEVTHTHTHIPTQRVRQRGAARCTQACYGADEVGRRWHMRRSDTRTHAPYAGPGPSATRRSWRGRRCGAPAGGSRCPTPWTARS